MYTFGKHIVTSGIAFLLVLCVVSPALAQREVEFDEDARHHLSLLIGGTYLDHEDATAFTLGGDYEYRVNRLLGLGFVVERAFGEIDATTILAVADIHTWRGLVIQTGPGIEILDDEEFVVGRIGALYEFEVGDGYTVSPQLHYDISDENSVVFALALGQGF